MGKEEMPQASAPEEIQAQEEKAQEMMTPTELKLSSERVSALDNLERLSDVAENPVEFAKRIESITKDLPGTANTRAGMKFGVDGADVDAAEVFQLKLRDMKDYVIAGKAEVPLPTFKERLQKLLLNGSTKSLEFFSDISGKRKINSRESKNARDEAAENYLLAQESYRLIENEEKAADPDTLSRIQYEAQQ